MQVVPAVAGVTFTLDGVPGVTGPAGRLRSSTRNLNGAAGRLIVAPNQMLSPTGVSGCRWTAWPTTPTTGPSPGSWWPSWTRTGP